MPHDAPRGLAHSAHILVPVAAAAFSAPALAESQATGSEADGSEAHAAISAPRSGASLESITRPQAAPDDAVASQAADELRGALDARVSGRILRSSTTSVYVVDALTGESIYERAIDEPLNPASNVKLVSTAAALDVLGPEWRYQMRVYGPLPREGVIRGDMYLRGGADPTLRAEDITALAREVAGSGVRRVEGDILIGPYRVRDAVGLAPVKVKVIGEQAGEPPRVEVEPGSAFFEIENAAETAPRGRARIRISKREVEDDEAGRAVLRVRGRVRAGREADRTFWIRNRAGFTAHAFRDALEEAGVEVAGAIRRERFAEYTTRAAPAYLPLELARHESAPLREILAGVNKPSNNFLADRVAMTAGAKLHGGRLSMETGLAAMDYWLLKNGLNPDEIVLDTGSGLSYETELSARHVVDVLRAAAGYTNRPRPPLTQDGILLASGGDTALARQARDIEAQLTPSPDDIHPAWARREPTGASYLSSLAVGGVDGTLARRFRTSQLRERVLAKTGTLTNIIALSGFVTDRDDNLLGFAIITNDHRRGLRTSVRNEHERMVDAMYRYLEARRAEREAPADVRRPRPDA